MFTITKMSTTNLYERFPTEEERDLWWTYQRKRMSAVCSTTDEERSGYNQEAHLIMEELMYIKLKRMDKAAVCTSCGHKHEKGRVKTILKIVE